jgi:hypothetical protein
MSEIGEEINSPVKDFPGEGEHHEINWNRIYFLILLYNGILIFLFYLLCHSLNHFSA